MPKSKVTIYDIASKLNVSPSTVSRALANSELISDEMKEIIHAKAIEMGYKSKKFKTNKGNTVAIIVPEINNFFYTQILMSLQKKIGKDFLLSIFQSFNSIETEKDIIAKLNSSSFFCAIVVRSMDSKDSSYIKELEKKGISVIMFNRVDYDYKCPKFVIDNYMDAFLLTKHLVTSKYRRIAFAAKHYNCPIYKERVRAYRDVLNNSGLRFNPDYLIYSELTYEDVITVVQKFIFLKPRPDAIILPGFTSALQAISICRKYNINIPNDMAIVSFDEDPECKYSIPTITGIERPLIEIGDKIGDLVLKIFNNKSYERSSLKVFKSNLVVRGSSLRSVINN